MSGPLGEMQVKEDAVSISFIKFGPRFMLMTIKQYFVR